MEASKHDWAQGYVLRGGARDGEAVRYWPDALTEQATGEVYLASGERDEEYPDLERFDLQSPGKDLHGPGKPSNG